MKNRTSRLKKVRVESRESFDDEQSRGLIFPEEEGESKVLMKRSKGGDCKLKVGPETLTDRKEKQVKIQPLLLTPLQRGSQS